MIVNIFVGFLLIFSNLKSIKSQSETNETELKDIFDEEAEQIALESMNEQLLPSESLISTIYTGLKNIRIKYPDIKKIRHQAKWRPGILFVYSNTTDQQINEINKSSYGPISSSTGSYKLLTFKKPYNPIALGKVLKQKFGVYSEPNGSVGRSEIITYDIYNSVYNIELRSGDCPAGCTEKAWWVFSVPPQHPTEVVLIEKGGTVSVPQNG